MSKGLNLVIAGGGTAGHVNAGITILDEFKKRYTESNVLFIGTRRGIEKDIVPRSDYPIKFIKARGLNRESIFVFLYSLFLIPISIIQSIVILLKFKADVVIGVGGFSSGAVLLSSVLLRKPIFLLEQNTVMGFTNRIFARYAKKIFTAFPLLKMNHPTRVKECYEEKIIHTGNPVRGVIGFSERSTKDEDKKTFNIFIFGGSQGARAINDCVAKAIPILNKLEGIKIVHQTGKLDFERIYTAYKDVKFEHKVVDYIFDIDRVYRKTDLVVSRAGSSTIFELLATCVPSILIPLPTSADNHQYFNAKYLSDKNGAQLIEQKDLTPQLIANRISYYKENINVLEDMRGKLLELSKQDRRPEEQVVDALEDNVR